MKKRKPGTCGAIITRGGRKYPCLHPRDHQCRHLIYTERSGYRFVALTLVAVVAALLAAGCSAASFDVADVDEAESGIGVGRDDGVEDGVGDAGGESGESSGEDAPADAHADAPEEDAPEDATDAIEDAGAPDTGPDGKPLDTGKPDTGATDTGVVDTADAPADTTPPPGTFACMPSEALAWFCSMGSHCCIHPDYYGTCASGGGCPAGVPYIQCNTNGDCIGSKVCCVEGASRVCRTSCGG